MASSPKDKPRAAPSEGAPDALGTPSTLDPDLGAKSPEPVLTYSPKKLRVQVTLTRSRCAESPLPPEDLVARAKAKMREEEEGGKVAFFTVYTRRLDEAWARLRGKEEGARTLAGEITLTLAAGAPPLPGLTVEAPTHAESESLAFLSIEADAGVASTWQVDWLRLHVGEALRRRGIEAEASATQIHGALLRAQAGQRVRAVALKPQRRTPAKDGQAFHLAVNRARGEVSLVVFDLSAVADLERVEKRIARTELVTAKLSSKRGAYRILRRELLDGIEAALSGPERLGLELPLVLLAAVGPTAEKKIKIAKEAQKPPKPEQVGAAAENQVPHLTVAVNDGRMEATVSSLTPAAAGDASRFTEEWLAAEVRRFGIVFGIRDGLLAEIRQRLAAGESVRGLVVASGTPALAGERPHLQLRPGQEEGGAGNAIRAYQRRLLVRAGELVAEVRYEVPPSPGKDVTGRSLPPPPGAPLEGLTLGEGIEEREGGRYYATFAGIVETGPGTLTLQKALVHEGDANLASGDIIFDGPVEITGNVDSGANVKASGDLIVKGEICGGRVEAGGTIVVGRGIVVGSGGVVRAKGDVKADFIENSTVICGGSLLVARSIMQSNVMVGGEITVTGAGGLVGGGTFVCGGNLRTIHLGLPDGALTEISAGVNFRGELTLRLRVARLEALTRQEAEERQTFKEVMKKPAARLSKVEKAAKDRLRGRMTRWSRILEAALRHVELAKARVTYSSEAKIFVRGKLSSNCQIKLGGKQIAVQEIVAVVITATPLNGSYLRPLSDGGG
jgi:uncharacterized protein (DUF342 family)